MEDSNKNIIENKNEKDEALTLKSIVVENDSQNDDDNDIHINLKKKKPLFSRTLNYDYQGMESDNEVNNSHEKNKDYINISRCDSFSSNNTSNSSQSNSHDCNSSCNSKTPINPKNNNDTECDIINGNFCSSDTILDKGSSSNSINNNINNDKSELENETANNDDSIILINEPYSLNDNINLNSNIQNDNMTTVSNGSNNFNDLTREELEPTSIAWNTWK